MISPRCDNTRITTGEETGKKKFLSVPSLKSINIIIVYISIDSSFMVAACRQERLPWSTLQAQGREKAIFVHVPWHSRRSKERHEASVKAWVGRRVAATLHICLQGWRAGSISVWAACTAPTAGDRYDCEGNGGKWNTLRWSKILWDAVKEKFMGDIKMKGREQET